jgi:hypothetical protein
MARTGISETTIARVLNHVSQTARTVTTMVYTRHDYEAEKRRALEAWATELERIVSGRDEATNVVHIAEQRTAR